jgi:hypothetical protein
MWKPAKVMLEALWNSGEVVIAGRVSGFQRLYDLAERVIPLEVLEAPEPDEETRLRELVVRAVRARGALTEPGIVEHWRLKGGAARIRPTVDMLIRDGVLGRLRVEDDEADVLVHVGTDLDPPRPTATVLLSPFDNLLWDRRFARRPRRSRDRSTPARRQFGYYVLPFLWRDRIVGRADLKTSGRCDTRRRGFHLELASDHRLLSMVIRARSTACAAPSGSSASGAERALALTPPHCAAAHDIAVILSDSRPSGRIRNAVTAPMVFTAAGLVVGVNALGLIDPSATGLRVKDLAEATLTVVLFSDASRIDLRALRGTLGVPARLLGVGLPLTLLAGFVAALGILGDLAWTEALLLAIILADMRPWARLLSRHLDSRSAFARASTSRAG